MSEFDGAQGVEEVLEGEIVQDGAEPDVGAGPFGGDIWARPAGNGTRTGPAGGTFAAPADAVAVKRRRGNAGVTLGAALVVAGAVLFAGRFNAVVAAGGSALWIGLGLLTWWAFRGGRVLLGLGSVLAGLGVGLMLGEVGFSGSPVALGLGVGLLGISALGALRGRRSGRWPLVLGVLLVLVGLLRGTSGWESLGAFAWPLALVVIGVVLVGASQRRRRSRT